MPLLTEWHVAAHEIKNYAALALANNGLIRLSAEDHNVNIYCDRIERSIQQINALVLEMLTNAAPETEGIISCDALRVLDGLIGEYRAAFPGIEFVWEKPVLESYVPAPATDIEKLFSNILKNAAEAAALSVRKNDKKKGYAEPSPAKVTAEAFLSGDTLTVRISDTGPGMDEKTLEFIMKGGYTTKPQGSGVGVPVCRLIAQKYGGTFTLGNRPEGGSVVAVTLPARGS